MVLRGVFALKKPPAVLAYEIGQRIAGGAQSSTPPHVEAGEKSPNRAARGRAPFSHPSRRGAAFSARYDAANKANALMNKAANSPDSEQSRDDALEAARLYLDNNLRLSPDVPTINRQIAALLNLAGNRGTQTKEAKSAALIAAKRMHEHGLTLALMPSPFRKR